MHILEKKKDVKIKKFKKQVFILGNQRKKHVYSKPRRRKEIIKIKEKSMKLTTEKQQEKN